MYRFSMLDFSPLSFKLYRYFPSIDEKDCSSASEARRAVPMFLFTKLESFASCFFHSISLSAAV
jgi:hypothetical protein